MYLRNNDAPIRLPVLLVLLPFPYHAFLPQLHPFDGWVLLPVLGQVKFLLEILTGGRSALVHLLKVRLLFFWVLAGAQNFLLLLVRILLFGVRQKEAIEEPSGHDATGARRANCC